jgi:hypothetical protein
VTEMSCRIRFNTGLSIDLPYTNGSSVKKLLWPVDMKFTLQIVYLKFASTSLIPDKGALGDVITQIVRSEYIHILQ